MVSRFLIIPQIRSAWRCCTDVRRLEHFLFLSLASSASLFCLSFSPFPPSSSPSPSPSPSPCPFPSPSPPSFLILRTSEQAQDKARQSKDRSMVTLPDRRSSRSRSHHHPSSIMLRTSHIPATIIPYGNNNPPCPRIPHVAAFIQCHPDPQYLQISPTQSKSTSHLLIPTPSPPSIPLIITSRRFPRPDCWILLPSCSCPARPLDMRPTPSSTSPVYVSNPTD